MCPARRVSSFLGSRVMPAIFSDLGSGLRGWEKKVWTARLSYSVGQGAVAEVIPTSFCRQAFRRGHPPQLLLPQLLTGSSPRPSASKPSCHGIIGV